MRSPVLTFVLEFALGQQVIFIPCDRVSARVVGASHDIDGMRYRVRRVMDINGQQAFVLFDLEQLGVIP